MANVESKTALESDICWCPVDSDIRNRARHNTIRMSEPDTSAVDLTFASLSPRVLMANVESKTVLESDICWCPVDSDIRNRARHNTIRMSEPGHQLTRRNCRFGPGFSFAAHRHRPDRSQQLPFAQFKRNARFDAFNWLIRLVFQRKSRL
jgi:hypothetical protein